MADFTVDLVDSDPIGDHRHDKGEEDIHHHARGDDRHPLRDALGQIASRIVEGLLGRLDVDWLGTAAGGLGTAAGGIVRRFGRGGDVVLLLLERFGSFQLLAQPAGIVLLPEHLDVAAQGQNAESVFRLAPSELAELPAEDIEPDVELFALHAAQPGNDEMAPFVNDDQHVDADEHEHDRLGDAQDRGGESGVLRGEHQE